MHAFVRFAVAVLLCLAPLSSHAVFRAYLSIVGSDTNPCSLGAPCRLLPAAVSVADDGGEVWIMDSGNFNIGTVTITKSVSIVAMPGVTGSILSLGSTPAFTVNNAPVKLTLKNLVIKSLPGTLPSGSSYGVQVISGASVDIEQCTLSNLVTGVVANGAVVVQLADSTVRDNTTGVLIADGSSLAVGRSTFNRNQVGISANPVGTTAAFAVEASLFTGNGTAINVNTSGTGGAVTGSISRTQVTKGTIGFVAATSGTATARVALTGNQIANNNAGVFVVGPGSAVVLSDNTIAGNNTGVLIQSGAVATSTASNTMSFNNQDFIGSPTPGGKL